MKLSIKNLKAALDFSTERRTVEDLKRSGTRSVRVISESQVIRLIEVIVEDTLLESGHVDPAERDRVVAAAKQRFDDVMQKQADVEARNKCQEETILSLQQRITQLVNEKQQMSVAQRQLEQQLETAARRATLAGGQPATVEVVERNPEELARLAEGMAQLQQWLARIEAKSGSSAADVDARLEQSMQKLIDRFGRTVDRATARPTEKRVEATDALLGKMLEGDLSMESNIGDLDVQERRTEGDIQRSLDRLRRAHKGTAKAKPAAKDSKDQTATDDRRAGPPDRRTDPPSAEDAANERRQGPEDRRSS